VRLRNFFSFFKKKVYPEFFAVYVVGFFNPSVYQVLKFLIFADCFGWLRVLVHFFPFVVKTCLAFLKIVVSFLSFFPFFLFFPVFCFCVSRGCFCPVLAVAGVGLSGIGRGFLRVGVVGLFGVFLAGPVSVALALTLSRFVCFGASSCRGFGPSVSVAGARCVEQVFETSVRQCLGARAGISLYVEPNLGIFEPNPEIFQPNPDRILSVLNRI
jgi:hypothetical protein